MSAPRIDSVDVARGLAALSVAVYHHGFGHALAQATGQSGFELIAWPGATLAVPLFFVISGFCIHLGTLARPPGPGFVTRFYCQRFVRIYPAWLVAVLVSLIILWLDGHSVSLDLILSHLTLTNGFFDDYRLNAALWSVSVESFLYLIYPLWFFFRRKTGLPTAMFLAITVSAGTSILTAHLQPVPTGPALWFFLNVWCGWVAGAVLAEIWSSPQRELFNRPAWWIGAAGVATIHLTLILQNFHVGPRVYVHLPITICLCVVPLVGLLLLGEKIAEGKPGTFTAFIWRTLATVGAFSYSLYLLHIPLQSLRFILRPALPDAKIFQLLVFVAWFGGVLGVSWLCYRWVELPSLRHGKKMVARFAPFTPKPASAVL